MHFTLIRGHLLMRISPWTSLALLAFAACGLPGCIAQEIRDELIKANQSLARADDSLAATNELLAGVRQDLKALEKTNEHLVIVGQQLAEVNAQLDAAQARHIDEPSCQVFLPSKPYLARKRTIRCLLPCYHR